MGAPRRSHKKYLSIFELQALIDSHRGESVYQPNKQGEDALAPWLLELLSIHDANFKRLSEI